VPWSITLISTLLAVSEDLTPAMWLLLRRQSNCLCFFKTTHDQNQCWRFLSSHHFYLACKCSPLSPNCHWL